MKKAYLISIRKVEVAQVYVLANSEEEAVDMVTEDTQCIEYYDYDTDGPEIYCEDEYELEELSPTQAIYDYDLNITIVGEIQEGGKK